MEKSIKNGAAYGGVERDVVRRYVAEHGHIPGHKSADSNSKMNGGTAVKMKEVHAFDREERKSRADDGRVDNRPAAARPAEASTSVAPSFDTMLSQLIEATGAIWNKALSDRGIVKPKEAVTNYLNGRASHDKTVNAAAVSEVREVFNDWDEDTEFATS